MGTVGTVAMLALSVASTAGSAIMQSKSAVAQGRATKAAAQWNAKAAAQRGAAEEARLRRKARRELSRQRVQFAKAGVQLEGSPLEVLAQNAAEFELDALNARIGAQNVSTLEQARGRQAVRRGRAQAGASLLSGAAQLVGTGVQMRSLKTTTADTSGSR